MTFWDGSAVVPLLVKQNTSSRARAWVAADAAIVLWTVTSVEVVSALRRLVREQALDEPAAHQAEARLEEMVDTCHVVVDMESVSAISTRLLRIHPVCAFDALQLGAALHWAEGRPQGRTLHTLDNRLAQAAKREGFLVPA